MTDSHANIVTSQSQSPPVGNNLAPIPNFTLPPAQGMMRVQQHLDLLLLALEALQIGGGEEMLATARELGLNHIIKNRISLWRLRCSNPWRKCYSRETLTLPQLKALILLVVRCAQKFVIPIRQLLVYSQQMEDKGLPPENHFRLWDYFSRFQSYFLRRMNPLRAKVSFYASHPDKLNQLALSLLQELLFYTGARGEERLWIRLFDGEL